jgi:hypothetical protein
MRNTSGGRAAAAVVTANGDPTVLPPTAVIPEQLRTPKIPQVSQDIKTERKNKIFTLSQMAWRKFK